MQKIPTNWIWLADWTRDDDERPQIVLFRKEIELKEAPESFVIDTTADARYKLYVNGTFVQEGPQKGTKQTWYMDSADLAPFLREGKNVIAALILRYPEKRGLHNESLMRTPFPCLYVRGQERTEADSLSGWKARRSLGIEIAGEVSFPAPLHVLEHVKAEADLQGWMLPQYDASAEKEWADVRNYDFMEIDPANAPFRFTKRTIPPMRHTQKRFLTVSAVRENASAKEWNTFLTEDKPITIPAHSRQIVEIDAGKEECGYPILKIAGGKGAKITFNKAECYSYPQPEDPDRPGAVTPLKGDRTDSVGGSLVGEIDTYAPAGYGTAEDPESYETFWFRTFRYYSLEIVTEDVPLTLLSFTYRETGYPIDVKTAVAASDPDFAAIWDISLRTLKRCMHETYVDCPYYEQLQYAQDSRSEILFTYNTAADDRLARECMEAFRISQREDGMIKCCSPSTWTNVIPGFSVYYILMLHDHMMYFGDRRLIRDHMSCVDGILNFFDHHLAANGMVGSVGGILFQAPYWSFIDWTPEWNETIGVPDVCLKGTKQITMESLLYLYGLQTAAELADYIGRGSTAEEYRRRAEALASAIRSCCMGEIVLEDGSRVRLIQDGPGIDEYSVHCQVFAVLTGIVSSEEGRSMLEATIGRPGVPQSSVSYMFYLFRALEKVGWYEKAQDLWGLWRDMLANHMTTCVENATGARSDCHAWASVILYEMPAVYLGVRPAAPGYEKIAVHPIPGHLTSASGDVVTSKGMVHVAWTKEGKEIKLDVKVPEGVECISEG